MDKEDKVYRQAEIAQLIKIEKDLRSMNETMLAILISEIELNRLTLKGLEVQFNVMSIKPVEMDNQIEKLMDLVKVYSKRAKEISNQLSLPSPDAKGEVTVNE
jgi:hypothetical protein